MSAASEHLDYHLGNAFAAHGVGGAALLAAVSAARSALLPLLGDSATHDEVASTAYNYARDNAPAAAGAPPPTAKPTAITEQIYRDRFGNAAMGFSATDRIALTRTLENELNIAKPPTPAERQKIMPVTRSDLVSHFGTAMDIDTLSARVRLSAANEILAARAKAMAS